MQVFKGLSSSLTYFYMKIEQFYSAPTQEESAASLTLLSSTLLQLLFYLRSCPSIKFTIPPQTFHN